MSVARLLRSVLGLVVLLAVSGCVRTGDPLAPIRPDPPVLSSAEPATLLPGAAAVVTVHGDRFRSSTTWSLEAPGVTLVSVTFIDETRVELSVSVAAIAPGGPVTVTAINPSSEPASAALFEVVEPAGPKLVSASPSSLLPGSSVTVSFNAENLEPGAVISGPAGVGLSWSSTVVQSATSCTAVATVDAGAAPGPRDVTVTNPGGKRGSAAGIVSVASAADPAIFSLSPASGPQGSSGLLVQVRGANFKAGATVAFGGGISVRGTTFASASRLDATIDIPASTAVASYDVTVTNPDGKTASARRAFAVSAPAVKLSTGVQPILTTNCGFAGCHGGGTPSLGLNLEPGQTWSNTVGVSSTEVPGTLRIRAGSPGSSYLVHKIEGTQSVGNRMPLGSPALSAAEIATIKSWILQGAPNN